MKSATKPLPETTAEYREGRVSRREHIPDGDNPYGPAKGFNDSRFRWFVGWYDENTVILLRRLEDDNNQREKSKKVG